MLNTSSYGTGEELSVLGMALLSQAMMIKVKNCKI